MARGAAYRDDLTRRPAQRLGWPVVDRRAIVLRLAAQLILLLVLLAAPWLMGGVGANAQQVLSSGLLVSLGLWLAGYLLEPPGGPDRRRMPLLIVPLILALVGGALQLVPLPDGFARSIGPEVVGGSETGTVRAGGIPRTAVSVNPSATRAQLAHLSFVLIALFLGSQLFAARQSQLCLYVTLALCGLAFSAFGIVQQLNWNGRLYWIGPEIVDGKPFAAFVNRNNAAGYLNLTLAAAIGFLIWAFRRRTSGAEWQYHQRSDGLSTGLRTRIDGWIVRLGQISPLQTLSGSCVALIAAGVVSSASRGGIAALGAAGAAVSASLIRRGSRGLGAGIGGLLAVVAAVLIVWLGTPGDIGRRFAELSRDLTSDGGRLANWKDTLRAVPEIWGTGSGFGTYGDFHRPYQRHASEGVYVHAENQYLEALIEGGGWGVGLLLAAVVLGFVLVRRLSCSTLIDPADGVACVGLFALVSQSLHACADFGLTQPANSLTLAVLMGSVAGRAIRKLGNGPSPGSFALPSVKSRGAFVLMASLLLVNGCLGWWEIRSLAQAERAVAAANAIESDADDAREATQPTDLLAAVESRADDARLQLDLARWYLRRYERAALTELRRVSPDKTERQIEAFAALNTLSRRANEFARAGLPRELQALRNDDLVQRTLVPARRALLASRKACGLIPRVELLLAQLAFLGEGPVDGRAHLERTQYLAPSDADLQFAVGALALDAGQLDLALDAWRRSYGLSHRHRYNILKQLAPLLTARQVIDSVLPDDSELQFAAMLDRMNQGAFPGVVAELAARLELQADGGELARSAARGHFLRGFRAWVNGDLASARESLQSALREQPDDPLAKVYLIEVLISTGDLDRADTLLADRAIPQKFPEEFKRLEFRLATARTERENDDRSD